MSFGTFYRVEDQVSTIFKGRVTKSDWYDALDLIDIQSYEFCDAEESMPAWILALKNEGLLLSLLFQGEMRAQEDECDHPDVVFVNKEMVASIVSELKQKPKSYYRALLDHVDCSADFWLFDPMVEFLKATALNDKALVVIWGS